MILCAAGDASLPAPTSIERSGTKNSAPRGHFCDPPGGGPGDRKTSLRAEACAGGAGGGARGGQVVVAPDASRPSLTKPATSRSEAVLAPLRYDRR